MEKTNEKLKKRKRNGNFKLKEEGEKMKCVNMKTTNRNFKFVNYKGNVLGVYLVRKIL